MEIHFSQRLLHRGVVFKPSSFWSNFNGSNFIVRAEFPVLANFSLLVVLWLKSIKALMDVSHLVASLNNQPILRNEAKFNLWVFLHFQVSFKKKQLIERYFWSVSIVLTCGEQKRFWLSEFLREEWCIIIVQWWKSSSRSDWYYLELLPLKTHEMFPLKLLMHDRNSIGNSNRFWRLKFCWFYFSTPAEI